MCITQERRMTMDKLDMDKPYLLTQAQRMDLLNSHNKLRDVGKLESLYCDLHRILKFVPKRGEDGHIIYGADWILIEHSKESDD